MARHSDDWRMSPLVENISGTLAPTAPLVTGEPREGRRCAYVVRRWRIGGKSPFCDAPTAPRASYCAHHLARCRVAPETVEGRRLAAAQAQAAATTPSPPRELARLEAVALAETAAEGETLAGLDVALPSGDDQ